MLDYRPSTHVLMIFFPKRLNMFQIAIIPLAVNFTVSPFSIALARLEKCKYNSFLVFPVKIIKTFLNFFASIRNFSAFLVKV